MKKEVAAIWLMCYCPGIDPQELLQFYKSKEAEGLYTDAFIPTYDQMKKYQGTWHVESRPVFPEYIFLKSNGKTQYRDAYVKDSMTLSPEQESLLQELMSPEGHIVMSTGYIKDGCTHVTDGPLQGKEKLIRKIDRHKRLAKLEFTVGDNKTALSAGLEITSKN